jgi:hypothetical protein
MNKLHLRRAVLRAVYFTASMALGALMPTQSAYAMDTSNPGGVTVIASYPCDSCGVGNTTTDWGTDPGGVDAGGGGGGGGGSPSAGSDPYHAKVLKYWQPPNIRADCSSEQELRQAYASSVIGYYRLAEEVKTGDWVTIYYENRGFEVWYVASAVSSITAMKNQGCHTY